MVVLPTRFVVAFFLAAGSAALPGSAPAGAQGLDGKVVYDLTCNLCHNKAGMGTKALQEKLGEDTPLLKDRKDLTPELIRKMVRKGSDRMQPIGLTEMQLQAVIDYLTDGSPEG